MGQIVTFYSYKGGVGRSFALVNVAAILASWGRRVLCVDWDLEAPGLQEYFAPYISGDLKKVGGVVDWVRRSSGRKASNWRNFVVNTEIPRVSFMAAGSIDEEYGSKVQSLKWDKLYKAGFGERLEEVRREWKLEYDFVLVDSRTGISDIGGICTVHLPDVLVALLVANDQNLKGTNQTLHGILRQREKHPVDKARLQILPVLSKVESRVEYQYGQDWIEKVADTLAWVYSGWLGTSVTVSSIVRRTRIPYIPFWSYGEAIPALTRRTDDPEDIGHSLASIAALLAHGLANAQSLLQNRDAYVDQARAPVQIEPGALLARVEANAVVVRAEGLTESIGKITCHLDGALLAQRADGFAVVNVQVFLNTNVSSRLIDDPWSEAVATLEYGDESDSKNSVAFRGRQSGANSIVFIGVQIPLGKKRGHKLLLEGIRCNANQLGLSSSLIKTSIMAHVQLTGFLENNSVVAGESVLVGFVYPGSGSRTLGPGRLSALAHLFQVGGLLKLDGNQRPAVVEIAEAFPGAFRTATLEKGDSGTRFMVRFSGLPKDAALMVSTRDLGAGFPRAQFVETDANGGGRKIESTHSGWLELPIALGTASSVWEWISEPSHSQIDPETIQLGVVVTSFSGNVNTDSIMVAVSMCPLSSVTTAASSAPIPRFADTSTPRRLFPKD